MILAQHRGVTLFARQNIWTEKYRNASPPILESCLCHWLVIYTLQASYFTRISRLFYLVITAFECILTVSAEMKPEVSVSIWKVTFASLIRRQSEANSRHSADFVFGKCETVFFIRCQPLYRTDFSCWTTISTSEFSSFATICGQKQNCLHKPQY